VIRAALVASSDLAPDLGQTVLYRRNVERLPAEGLEQVRQLADSGRLDVVVVDSALPGAASIVSALRQDPTTRAVAIVALGRSEFGFDHLELLQSGANAILPLPPGQDWDDRLMRLIHVPVRKTARFPVNLSLQGGLRDGAKFAARVLNLSVHGLLLECRQPLRVGEDMHLAFDMPSGHGAVAARGTVVRQALEDRFGVELTHVEGDGRVRIKRYVEAV
jgi:CheY-like chemotaxis protein